MLCPSRRGLDDALDPDVETGRNEYWSVLVLKQLAQCPANFQFSLGGEPTERLVRRCAIHKYQCPALPRLYGVELNQ